MHGGSLICEEGGEVGEEVDYLRGEEGLGGEVRRGQGGEAGREEDMDVGYTVLSAGLWA